MVLKPFISSDSQKLTNIKCGCWRICNQPDYTVITIINRLQMQDLLYLLPDMEK